MGRSLRWTLVGVVVLAVAGVLGYLAWQGDDSDPSADETLVKELEDTGLTLFDVRLRDAEPDKPKVSDGRVEIRYTEGGYYAWSLSQARAPKGNLCVALKVDPAGSCEYADGVMRYTFEEMSDAAVVRGDTLLRIGGMVTEVDPELLDEAVAALQNAPEVNAQELATQ